MFVRLSFSLSITTPTPGGRRPLEIQVDESIDQGHPGNTFYYTAWNHTGTHVDAPAHMITDGKRITDYPIDQFIFDRPLVIDVPKEDDELIDSSDLRPFEGVIVASDLLLLRTGFTRYRDVEPVRYRDHNPGLSVDAARYLRRSRFPLLRAVGLDTISAAAAALVAEGIEAHKVLFSRTAGPSVLIIEDVDLSPDLSSLRRVFVVPMFVEGLDSCPCTIIAETESEP